MTLAIIQVGIEDQVLFDEYVAGHLPTIQAFGGQIVSVDAGASVREDAPDDFDLVVVQQWPSVEAFDRWHGSDEYAPWRALRVRATRHTRVLLVETPTPG